jgi:TP901 family phage tail tape measure protein
MRQIIIEILASGNASSEIYKNSEAMLAMGNASLKAFGQFMVWQRMGRTMANAGDSILRAAAAGVKMAADWDYNMRVVRTQTNLTDKQFADLKNRALDITKSVPQAASDVSTALYDIFSSTDVGYKQAVFMVKNFAQAATAGATDISVAEKSIISEMNAYQLPVKDTTHLLDLQFQMVRYGVGTYEQFASAIGNMLPAGRNMNQTLETLSGAAAFMSRNGFTASQSVISIARAMDQLVRHRADIKDTLGIDIVDTATGKYKQLGTIMDEFATKMAGMTGPEREKAFQAMFGAGEIRAMRFFRVAVPNIKALDTMIGHMDASKGALGRAFGDVKASPIIQFRIEMNRLRVDAIALANQFLPYISKFIGYFAKLLDWLDRLPAPLKNVLAIVTVLAGVFLALGGRIVMAMSAIKGMVSIMGLAGLSFTELMGPVGIVLGGLTAVALVAYLIIKNWGAFSRWWKRNWDTIKSITLTVVGFIAPLLAVFLYGKIVLLAKLIMSFAGTIKTALGLASLAFKAFIASNWITLVIGLIVAAAVLIIMHWGAVKRFLIRLWNDIKSIAIAVWGTILHFFTQTLLGKIILAVVAPWVYIIKWLVDHWKGVVAVAQAIWNGLVAFYHAILEPLGHYFAYIWGVIVAIAKSGWTVIFTVISMGLKALSVLWKIYWDAMSLVWKILWQGIKIVWYAIGYPLFLVIMTTTQILFKFWKWVFENLLRPLWDSFWANIKGVWETIGKPVFHIIGQTASDLWHNVLLPTFDGIKKAWNAFWTGMKWVWTNIGLPAINAITKFWQGLGKVWGAAWDGVARGWSTFWSGLERTAANIVNGILGVLDTFIRIFITGLNWVRKAFGLSPITWSGLGRVHWGQAPGGGGGGGMGHLARGTQNWQGGFAWVGEEGPEMMYVPKGSRVWPAPDSAKTFGRPGFQGGLGMGINEGLISLPGGISALTKAIAMGVSKGSAYLVNTALKMFHITAPLIKNVIMTGGELLNWAKNQFLTWAKKQIGTASAPGGHGGSSFPGAGGVVGGWGPAGSPNANFYRQSVQMAWPLLRFAGIYNRRFIAGTHIWSQHAYGNAVDEMVPSLGYGDMVYAWARAHSGLFHLAHLLWRVPDHFNHIHADFWPQGIGTPRANGGPIYEPIVGMGKSGRMYSFGEKGPEWVSKFPTGGAGHTFNFYGIHQHDADEIVRAINWELATDGR